MIYFLEHDTAGNICHVCSDPSASIVPVINRVLFKKKDGTPMKDASGNDLSPFSVPMADPVGITAEIYAELTTDGMQNYMYDTTTNVVVKKVAPIAPAKTS
jgi:hypothetical protein